MPKSVNKEKLLPEAAHDESLDDSSSFEEDEFKESDNGSVESNIVEPQLLLGIKLDSTKKEVSLDHEFAEKTISEVVESANLDSTYPVIIESGTFRLRGAALGAEAKPDERNVLEVEANWHGNSRFRLPIACLASGTQETCVLNIDLSVSQEAKLYLTQGSGPISVNGQQEIAYTIDEGQLVKSAEDSMMDAGEEEAEDEEEDAVEELPKKIISKSTAAPKAAKRKTEMDEEVKKKKPKTIVKSSKVDSDTESEDSEGDSDSDSDGNMAKRWKKDKLVGKGKLAVSVPGKAKGTKKKSDHAGGKGKRQRVVSVRL